MAYFGLLVPNTGLVKSATSLWWSQGISYFLNLFNPYWLWIPVVILIAVKLQRGYEYKTNHRAMILVLSPLFAGLASIGYITAIGGDFMHGRLLLPGLFCLLMGASESVTSWRRAVPVVLVSIWCVVCVSTLRWGEPPLGRPIGDERTVAMLQSHSLERSKHPITAADYARSKWYRFGLQLRKGAAHWPPGSTGLVLGANPSYYVPLPTELPPIVKGHNEMGSPLIAATRPIGQVGFAAGSRVYIFDELSLANPVSSHFIVHVRTKPGHEKVAPMSWYLGRFGQPSDVDLLNRYRRFSYFEEVTTSDVVAARSALSCGQLRVYLRGITAPLTPSVMVSNLWNAWSNTTMTFDADPVLARRQLCHG
jgi:arabinofuranosyltransferase